MFILIFFFSLAGMAWALFIFHVSFTKKKNRCRYFGTATTALIVAFIILRLLHVHTDEKKSLVHKSGVMK